MLDSMFTNTLSMAMSARIGDCVVFATSDEYACSCWYDRCKCAFETYVVPWFGAICAFASMLFALEHILIVRVCMCMFEMTMEYQRHVVYDIYNTPNVNIRSSNIAPWLKGCQATMCVCSVNWMFMLTNRIGLLWNVANILWNINVNCVVICSEKKLENPHNLFFRFFFYISLNEFAKDSHNKCMEYLMRFLACVET